MISDHEILLANALMTGFSMFSLKEPSLLAFGNRRMSDNNLHSVYLIKDIPCDTWSQTILPLSLLTLHKVIGLMFQNSEICSPEQNDQGI